MGGYDFEVAVLTLLNICGAMLVLVWDLQKLCGGLVGEDGNFRTCSKY